MSGGLLMRLQTRETNERLTGVVVRRTLEDACAAYVGLLLFRVDSVPKWMWVSPCTVVKRIN